jgi:dephospho-CoA kinase
MFILGLTGQMGSGKSEVARILRKLGAEVIDVDALGHEILKPTTPQYTAVINAFGHSILDKFSLVDRKLLSQIAFQKKELIKKLETILHPPMRRKVLHLVSLAERKNKKLLVIDAALLAEMKLNFLADQVWVVIAPKAAILKRVKKSRALSNSHIIERLQLQKSSGDYKKLAQQVINNNGSLAALQKKVKELYRQEIKPLL